LDVEDQIIFNLWRELQNYVANDLYRQNVQGKTKTIGEDFEKVVHKWVGTTYRTLRLTYERKKGASGTKHEFDIIVAVPQDAKVRNNGLLFECKNIYIGRLCKKHTLTKSDAHSVLLNRESVMTFLMKCYDAYPEGFFDTMFLDKVYPTIISTKPLTRDAFKFTVVYGVTVIQPSRDHFLSFMDQLSKYHSVRFDNDFFEELSKNASYYPPLHALNIRLQMLVQKLGSLGKKDEMDLLRLRARLQELALFMKTQKREVGALPKRGKEFLDFYDFGMYMKYLDHLKQASVLENEIMGKYGIRI
jgi:hypothetical protein